MKKKAASNQVRGIRTWKIGCGFLIAACILIALTVHGLVHVTAQYQDLIRATDDYINAEGDIRLFEQATGYLTNQARQCVVTMDKKYIDAYFEEINETQRREHAVAYMQRLSGRDGSAYGSLETVMKKSQELMDLEIHSMKLVSVMMEFEREELPQEVRDYELSEEEKNLSEIEMKERSYQLVFGSTYADLRQEIDDELVNATAIITDAVAQEQADCAQLLQDALIMQRIYIFLLFILFVLIFIILAFYVIFPINRYIRHIENGRILEIKGLYEFKRLALTYNQIFERNAISRQNLQHKAEHDALTGLWNREAFEQLKNVLKESFEPFALLLIDVDNFKNVNDNFGHDTGDCALKRIAVVLKEQFRSNDYPLRIGGDEFAVFLMNITPKDREIIRGKINMMNEILQRGEENLPKLSVSVGIAFAQSGYSDELYRKADRALYKTKEHGRCGCTFYGE